MVLHYAGRFISFICGPHQLRLLAFEFVPIMIKFLFIYLLSDDTDEPSFIDAIGNQQTLLQKQQKYKQQSIYWFHWTF